MLCVSKTKASAKTISGRRLGTGLLGYFLVAALSSVSHPAAAIEVLSIHSELSKVKSQLLPMLAADLSDENFAYLDIDADLALRYAELQILSADGQVSASIPFTPAPDDRLLLRTALPQFERNQQACRFVIETLDDGEPLRQIVDCELPETTSANILEIRFRERWFKPKLDIRLWNSSADPATAANNGAGHLAELLRRLQPGATSFSLPRKAEGRAGTPDVRYMFVQCTRDPWRGMQRLYQFKQLYGDALPAAFWWAYGDCALRGGVRSEAVTALHNLQQLGSEQLAYQELRLQLASSDARWGDTSTALGWLTGEPADIPIQIRTHWRDLKSRLSFIQGRDDQAAKILASGRHLQAAGYWLESFTAAPLHYAMRINYAYALMQTGKKEAALAVLDRVGNSPALDNETEALRGQANSKLGWYFLKQGYGATSGRIFHRMSTQDQNAREALLGMGWALLAPKGETQQLISPPGFTAVPSDPPPTTLRGLRQTGAVGCEQFEAIADLAVQSCIPNEKFAQLKFGDDPKLQLKRALRFWTVLLEDDSVNDAVMLEAHIASADAFSQLGDQQRAQSLYRHTMKLSAQAQADIDRTGQALQDRAQLTSLASGDWTLPVETRPSVFAWLAQTNAHYLLAVVAQCQELSTQITNASAAALGQAKIATELAQLRGRIETLKTRALRQISTEAKLVLKRERENLQRYNLHALMELSQMQQSIAFSEP